MAIKRRSSSKEPHRSKVKGNEENNLIQNSMFFLEKLVKETLTQVVKKGDFTRLREKRL